MDFKVFKSLIEDKVRNGFAHESVIEILSMFGVSNLSQLDKSTYEDFLSEMEG